MSGEGTKNKFTSSSGAKVAARNEKGAKANDAGEVVLPSKTSHVKGLVLVEKPTPHHKQRLVHNLSGAVQGRFHHIQQLRFGTNVGPALWTKCDVTAAYTDIRLRQNQE